MHASTHPCMLAGRHAQLSTHTHTKDQALDKSAYRVSVYIFHESDLQLRVIGEMRLNYGPQGAMFYCSHACVSLRKMLL